MNILSWITKDIVIYNQHVDKLNATSEQIVYEATHDAFFYGDIQSTKTWWKSLCPGHLTL